MGLFDKKTCAFCGEQSGIIGGLFGENLVGGAYMCGECRQKCTPNPNLNFGAMTVEDVKANMAVAEANRKKGTSEFLATHKLQKGPYRDYPLIEVDTNHGWLMQTEEKNGWVFNLDDIFYFNMDLTFAPLEEGESFSVYTDDYPELPRIPYGMRVTDASLVLWFADSELGVDKLALRLLGFAPGEDDVRSAYLCAHEFFEIMKSYRIAQKKQCCKC